MAMPPAIARLTSPTPPSKQTGFRERGRSSKHRCSIACQVWRLRSGGVGGRHSATRVPSPRVEREFTVRELCAADVAHAVLLLVRQRAQVLARGANAEHERVPEIIEARVVRAGAERTTDDVLETRVREPLRDVALRRADPAPLTLGARHYLAHGAPEHHFASARRPVRRVVILAEGQARELEKARSL